MLPLNSRLLVSGDKKSGTVYQNLIMQLRKVCNHPFLFNEIEDQINPNHLINDLVVRASGKFELLDVRRGAALTCRCTCALTLMLIFAAHSAQAQGG